MPVTLAQATVGLPDDFDLNVINEFRSNSALLDSMEFHGAEIAGGFGSSLTHNYTRTLALRSADFRPINSEYTPAEATKAPFSVDLKPLGGSYQIDRVLAASARGREVGFQTRELITATIQKFNDEVINGDVAVDADGFDGLDKALTGSTTELTPNSASTAFADWTDLDTSYHTALDLIDELLGLLDGQPGAILANRRAASKLRAIARRANQYVSAPVDGLNRDGDRPVVRQFWQDGTLLIDLGDKPGTANPVIPIETRDPDGAGPGGNITGLTDIYAVRFGMDGFHGVGTTNIEGNPSEIIQNWMPDFTTSGAVKTGETELGPLATVLKATRAAAVLRNVKVQ